MQTVYYYCVLVVVVPVPRPLRQRLHRDRRFRRKCGRNRSPASHRTRFRSILVRLHRPARPAIRTIRLQHGPVRPARLDLLRTKRTPLAGIGACTCVCMSVCVCECVFIAFLLISADREARNHTQFVIVSGERIPRQVY